MCIDLYAPGQCIDIPFLYEHIYLSVGEGARPPEEQLHVTEVYDVLLHNPPGNEPLTELFVLFPHDCTEKTRDGTDALRIEAPQVAPELSTNFPKYEWPFLGPPKWVGTRRSEVERTYAADPIMGSDALEETESGVALIVKVGFPKRLRDQTGAIETLFSRNKTFVQLKFEGGVKLEGGQKGWLRLIVKPREWDAPKVRLRQTGDGRVECTQWLNVCCPIIIRDRLNQLLDSAVSAGSKDSESSVTRAEVHRIVLSEGCYSEGTSTRIKDHRIAIAAQPEIDIDNPVFGRSAHFHGVQQLDDRGEIALLWGTGSSKNSEADLVHNAQRVQDRLEAYNGSDRERELVRDLALSGKNEAFSLLVEKMRQVELLDGQGDFVSLPNDPSGIPNALVRLRQLYASREGIDDNQLRLMQDFMDLHPFSIHFRAGWRELESRFAEEAR